MGPEGGFIPPEVGLNAMKEEQRKNTENIAQTQQQIDARKQELDAQDTLARSLEEEDREQQNKPFQVVDKRSSFQENTASSSEEPIAENDTGRDWQISPKDETARGITTNQVDVDNKDQPFKDLQISPKDETVRRVSVDQTLNTTPLPPRGFEIDKDGTIIRGEHPLEQNNEVKEQIKPKEQKSPFETQVDMVFERKRELSEELTGLKAKLNELRSQETSDQAIIQDLESRKNAIEIQKAVAEKEVNKIKMSYLGKIGSVARLINIAEQQKQGVRDNLYNQKEGVWALGEIGKLDAKISQLKADLEEKRNQYTEGFKNEGDPRLQAQRELIAGYEKNLQALQEGRASERREEVKQEAEQMVLSASVTGPIVTSEARIDQRVSPKDVEVRGMTPEISSGEQTNLPETTPEEHDDNIEVQRGQELALIENAHDEETETQERGFRARIGEFLGRVQEKVTKNFRKIGKFALILGACAALIVGAKSVVDNYSADNVNPGHKVTNSAVLEARETTPQFYVEDNHIGPEITPPPDDDSPDDGLKITPDNNPNSGDGSADRTVTETGDQIETHNTSGDIPVKHLSNEPNGIESPTPQVEHSPAVERIYDFADKEYGIPSNIVDQVLADNPSASQDLQNRINTFQQDKQINPNQTFDKGETDPVKAATTEWFESWFSGRI